MVEFAINNNKFAFAILSLFFILKCIYLCISFDIINFLYIITYKQINKKKVIDILEAIQSI